jgi:TonB-dependent starch-binding outer membrane protein SusC
LNMGFQNNGKEILSRWTKAGDITDVPRLWTGRDNFTNWQSNGNSRFVEDGDFLRLQNIVLSYTFDSKRLDQNTNGIIKSLRIFAQGQNLAVWTKYTGVDPENNTEFGLDNNTSPQARMYTIGFNIGF